MKLSKTAIAVGAAVATLAGTASAATPLSPIDATLYLSSATALRDTFSRMVAAYCDPAQPRNVYEYNANRNYRAYECQFKAASDPAVGALLSAKSLAAKKVRVYHTVDVNGELGGSIVGVMPIYHDIPMEFVIVDPACSANGTESVTGFTRWNCTVDGSGNALHEWRLPNAGASDTEPSTFRGVNLPGTLTVDPANGSVATATLVNLWKTSVPDSTKADNGDNVSFKNMFAVGFGIAATKAAIAAGITNLSRDQAASIYAGQIEDWGSIFPALAGTPVGVCRRTAGSGTQASWNAFFNYNPCGDVISTSLPVATKDDSGAFGMLTVVENSATSGVKSCLSAADNGTAFNSGNRSYAAGEIPNFAIGHISLENNETAADWEFIAIDGVKPFDVNEKTVAGPDGVADGILEDKISEGLYSFYEEPTMQWRTSGARAISGTTLNLASLIRDNAGNPVITKQLPGVLSLPTSPSPRAPNLGENNYSRIGEACKPSRYIP